MKILLALERFEVGGITSFVEVISNFLSEQGVEATILGALDKRRGFPFSKYFLGSRVKVYTYGLWLRKRWLEDFSRVINAFFSFRKLIKEEEFDLLVFNHPSSALGVLFHSKSKKIPKVFHFHGAWDIEEKNALNLLQFKKRTWLIRFSKWLKEQVRLFLYHKIESFCLKRSDVIAVLSLQSKKLLIEHFGINRKKIEILPSGVNQDIYRPKCGKSGLRKKLNIPTKTPFLFSLSRFDQKKGIPNLLRAVAILRKKGLNFKLIIAGPVGSGWFYNQDIFYLYESLSLQTQVEFVHGLDNSEKLDYLLAADLFVFPSIGYEAYPYVIMEAMSTGLPIVATPVGGVVDMLSGPLAANFLVNDLEPDSLAQKIEELLVLLKKNRRSLRAQCRSYAESRFDGVGKAAAIFSCYQKMLK